MRETPCQVGDPDHWFLEKDGRQYRDEPLEIDPDVMDSVIARAEDWPADRVKAQLEKDQLKANLIARRKAKDACFTDCYTKVRAACLALGMKPENQGHGIYGGYYPEERAAIQAEIDLRDTTS